jgi:hypothetical protein
VFIQVIFHRFRALRFRIKFIPKAAITAVTFAAPLYVLLAASPAANASAVASKPASELPDAPGYSHAHASGMILGTVTNPRGAGVTGASITVSGEGLASPVTVHSLAGGSFRVAGLAAGNYTLKASAKGFLPATPPTVVLGSGEHYKLSITIVPVPKAVTTVKVVASPAQIATAQVRLEEKQRILGFIPNFSTSYEWNAAPLTPKLKYNLALHVITDPYTFAVAAGLAGVEQGAGYYPGYGGGWQGYGKRFGASYADGAIARFTGGAVYASLLHQDPRYFYKGHGSTASRLWYAIRSAFVTRGDNGRPQPNYSELLGDFTAAGASNLYLSPHDRSARITIQNGLVVVAGDAIENIMREFLTKGHTSHIPPGANGETQ